ncbi:hypothetical protein Pst134EA_003242 [Puccinia striiformis f. sp. tritici]|uniref:Condensin complex subunit 2 n=2 Tax=Puccinia striiformis TaxID=27350 RepID=A0A0L0UX21_9BASI|nr:hypothetical protein Pst134EA_003242 [Puccinia striiformis f. sp. tritici]KAH9472635.1 hypothetical protein Pst134EA_003242 [Puccinia striiformis f. sp. tritici]KAI9620548.1 hypothetical protein KEM48_008085 [Puccinia striiformis f. sp. tritici PST-130]KNE91575.1 hypothetical protein PSTG_15027 [Puccinia striiformis f. sp. tritici PST-78]POW19483.1 hypothetical protein PSHT_04627 [Puccinia striiformis]
MAIKRPRSANPTQARDKTGGSILMSPSSSSSTASENRREPKRTKKTPRRNTSATSSSSDEDEEEVGNPTDWNQKEGSSIQKKKNLTLAEHAKRRLSGKLGLARRSMNFDQPPSAHSSPARAPGNGRVGALARARENHAKARQSIGVAQDNPLVISTEVMNNNYDEWMKMATDNKINVNNTWSFALIDYFHDMSLLRNPEAEGGINFQKASCTLDGCVKIWTSRVDSVATETGKLLSGLAEEANNISNQIDGEDDEDAGEESGLKAPKKTRTRATNSTSLVEFNEKIKVKELELEFTVDPLFKKTCADFDEGGSGGILMSHLSVDSSMTIIFDASGKPFSQNSDDDSPTTQDAAEEERPILLDVSKLKSAFLDSVEGFQARSICPCLSNFKFSTTDTIQSFESLAALANMPEKLDDLAVTHDAHDTGNDFFDSNESPNLGEDNFQMPDQEDVDDEGVDMGETYNPGGVPNQRDLLMALVDDNSKQAETGQSIFGQESTGMFDYFDKSMKKSWAGPEHWKLRRTVAFKSRDDENATTINRTKREKSTFSFDFLKPLENGRKSIFQAGSASLTLPGYKPPKPKSQRRMIKKIVGSKAAIGSKQMLEQHCLPDDMHFNASQLLRFDMKPKTTFNMRVKASGSVAHNPGAEIDENYWARTAAAAAAQNNADQTNLEEDSNDAIPFATQFFQDEPDDQPDFEEEFDNPVGMTPNLSTDQDGTLLNDPSLKSKEDEHDLIAATQNLNVRARPEFVNYAKKAKRVDVKRLKENIWRELEELTTEMASEASGNEAQGGERDAPENQESEEASTRKKTKTFTKVINGLRTMYPQEKMEEISTSFCFICLLHLANEKGLSIQSISQSNQQLLPEDSATIIDDNLIIDSTLLQSDDSKFVGRLEELKILREAL